MLTKLMNYAKDITVNITLSKDTHLHSEEWALKMMELRDVQV